MADENEAQESSESSGGGGSKTPILLVATALISVAVGAGLNFVFTQPAPPADAAAVEGEAGEAGGAAQSNADFRERVVAFEPFVVNLRGADYPRYVKIRLEMEADSVESKTDLEARVAQVRDAVILLLSSKELSQVTEFEGKAFLKDELLQRVNDVIEVGSVRSVFFTEFVIQ